MKQILFILSLITSALVSKAQFLHTDELIRYLLNTVTNRNPETTVHAQIQNMFLDTSILFKQKVDSSVNSNSLPDWASNEYLKSWTVQKTPIDRIWVNLAWSPEFRLLVAVSHSGTNDGVMTSRDGTNWEAGTCPAQEWRGIAWSSELRLFAAVGSSGTGNRVMTSPDGKTWINRNSTGNYKWRDIVWADKLGLFVAVANTGGYTDKVMTSSDGITWTARQCPDREWSDIVWAPEINLLVVSATSGIPGEQIMTSSDGINRTARATPVFKLFEGLTWSPDLHLFCAVAFSNTSPNVMTSPDGINWTVRNSPTGQWLSVAWSPELHSFAAVGDNGSGVMTSADGINWKEQYPDKKRLWRRVYWIKELGSFVAVAYTYATSGVGNLIMMTPPIDPLRTYNPPVTIATVLCIMLHLPFVFTVCSLYFLSLSIF